MVEGNAKTISLAGMIRFFSALLLVVVLTACGTVTLPKLPFNIGHIIGKLRGELKEKQVYVGDPVYIRIFKEENILELWMKPDNAYRYTLIKTYPICKWSGYLGPKLSEGDFQSPEGFYKVEPAWLHPTSRYHVAFNIQYPNDYDRVHGRTGSFIMVHGDCVSEGCYAMTDRRMEEIYTLVERALDAGQPEVPVHIFPFRMTAARMARAAGTPWYGFWSNLKEGYDYFEINGVPPRHIVVNKRYVFY